MVEIQHRMMNLEALDSPIYNPKIDQNTAELYNLMAPTATAPDSDETLQPFVDQIESLPTTNIFAGVLINPRHCDIAELRETFTEIRTLLPAIRTLLPTEDQVPWDSDIPAVIEDLDEIEQITDDFEAHTDRLSFNLPSLVGIAQGAMGLATALESLANPCLGSNNFFGSLMEKGRQLIGGLRTEIGGFVTQLQGHLQAAQNAVLGAIGPVISQITSAMSSIRSAFSGVADMIRNEVLNFAKGLLGQQRLSLAEFMSFLRTNPCLKALGGMLGSSSASSILGRIT